MIVPFRSVTRDSVRLGEALARARVVLGGVPGEGVRGVPGQAANGGTRTQLP